MSTRPLIIGVVQIFMEQMFHKLDDPNFKMPPKDRHKKTVGRFIRHSWHTDTFTEVLFLTPGCAGICGQAACTLYEAD
jgi:hypothetical protein